MKFQTKAGLLLSLVALAAGLGACGAPESESPAKIEAPTAPAEVATETPELDKGAVGLIRDRYIAAVDSGNLDELMSLWTDNGVLLPPDQPAVVGKEAIRTWYQGMFSQFEVAATLRPAETHIASDWGFDRGAYTLTLTPKAPAPATGNPPAELIDPPMAGTPGTQAPEPEGAIASPGAQAPPATRPAGPSTTLNVKYLVVVKRGDGGNWQVVEYIWNFDAPAPRPRAAAAETPPA
jgi:ketosteroid isomerase-like protein